MEINKYIADLLNDFDCVIIPGLGGFVGSYQPARIHVVYHTFQPPSKKILFNVNLKQNDGLLANHIGQAERVSFTDANRKIQEFVESVYRSLKAGETLFFPNVGKIYLGSEGTLQFEQDPGSNLLAESFGLQPFFSPPVLRDHTRGKPEKHRKVAPTASLPARKALTKPLKWAAILAFPIAVAIFLSISGYDKLKSGSWNYADILSSITQKLSPFSSAGVQSPPEVNRTTYQMELPAKEPAVKDPAGDGKTVPAQKTGYQQPLVREGSYVVIIGAFREKGNADKLIRMMTTKGMEAFVYDRSSGGLYRVSSGVFQKKDDALKTLGRMRSGLFPDAWILKNRL